MDGVLTQGLMGPTQAVIWVMLDYLTELAEAQGPSLVTSGELKTHRRSQTLPSLLTPLRPGSLGAAALGQQAVFFRVSIPSCLLLSQMWGSGSLPPRTCLFVGELLEPNPWGYSAWPQDLGGNRRCLISPLLASLIWGTAEL